jgi:hypothetical protein
LPEIRKQATGTVGVDDRLSTTQDLPRRRHDRAGVGTFIDETHAGLLTRRMATSLSRLDAALLVLEPDDRPSAHPGRASRFVHGPLQRDPGHSALDGRDHRARRKIPLGRLLRGQYH